MAKGKGQSGGRGRGSSKKRASKSETAPSQAGQSPAGGSVEPVAPTSLVKKSNADTKDAPTPSASKAAAPARRGSDVPKWIAVAVLVVGAIAGFYVLSDQSTLLRVVMLLVVLGGAGFLASTTVSGAAAVEFVKDSRTELRKVVWPTRKETVQTTGLILVVVTIVALFIWMLDSGLGALVKMVIGGPA